VRRWRVRVYPERTPELARRGAAAAMTVTFNVRADTRDEALHVAQAHRPDLKSWIWELEEVRL
jgi:hypothetical protein